MKGSEKRPLIAGRVMLVGEGRIPKEVVERVKDEHMKLFLREPNPMKWPKEMEVLVRYLPAEERLQWEIHREILHWGEILDEPLKRWVDAVWGRLVRGGLIRKGGAGVAIEQMHRYLRERLLALIQTGEGPGSGEVGLGADPTPAGRIDPMEDGGA